MFPNRLDLIVHDPEGFESAGNRELVNVEEFLKTKLRERDINQRLHAVWYGDHNPSVPLANLSIGSAWTRVAAA